MRAEIHVIEATEQQLQKLVAAAKAARRTVFAQEPNLKDPKRGQLILAQLNNPQSRPAIKKRREYI
jgi:hypothetical protein